MNIGQAMHNREEFSKGNIRAIRFDGTEAIKNAENAQGILSNLKNDDLTAFLQMFMTVDYIVIVNDTAVAWTTTYGEVYNIKDIVDIGAQALIVNCLV